MSINSGGISLPNKDFRTLINSVGNDLKIAIDDLTGILIDIKEDLEKLKKENACSCEQAERLEGRE